MKRDSHLITNRTSSKASCFLSTTGFGRGAESTIAVTFSSKPTLDRALTELAVEQNLVPGCWKMFQSSSSTEEWPRDMREILRRKLGEKMALEEA